MMRRCNVTTKLTTTRPYSSSTRLHPSTPRLYSPTPRLDSPVKGRLGLQHDVPSQIYALRQSERVALYRLRETADAFIRQADLIMTPARAVANPESVLRGTVPRQYISTERYNVAARTLEVGNAIIGHARDIQEHCRDLEHEEPPPPPKPDALYTQRPDQPEPDLVAFKLEERARRTEVVAKLKRLNARIRVIKRVVAIASDLGPTAAIRYLKQFDGKGELLDGPLPVANRGLKSDGETASFTPLSSPAHSSRAQDDPTRADMSAVEPKRNTPTSAEKESSATSASWEQLSEELDNQLDKEQAGLTKSSTV